MSYPPIERAQRTLKRAVTFRGMGVFTGIKGIEMSLQPAPEGTGISFQRVDLPNSPSLEAHLKNVEETPYHCTTLGNGRFQIQTVEHLLSALRACDLDNAVVKINAPEIPIGDGSALPLFTLLQQSGILSQKAMRQVYRLRAPIFWSRGEVHLVALPAEEFRISYTFSHPKNVRMKAQFHTICLNRERYGEEIAPARTFALYEEVMPLIESGVIKGGSLDHALVIRGEEVLNPDGMRYEDEMVRHKILDLIGDLSLIGVPFLAHIIAIRSGHAANISFARELFDHFRSVERTDTLLPF